MPSCVFRSRLDSTSPTIVVEFGDVRQTMEGFGASDRFLNDDPFTDPQADLLFDVTAGIGLSMLNVGIVNDGSIWSFYSNATKAAARGARIMAGAHTAPAAWKDNNNIGLGGHLLVARYADWANRLAVFPALLQSNAGVDLYAIEVQIEPDYSDGSGNPQMLWTAAEMNTFIKANLGPALAALTPVPKLIMPSTAGWQNEGGYTSVALADGTTAPYVYAVGVHQYGDTANAPTVARPYWMTEYSSFDAFDASITNALAVAAKIHAALTTGNASVWNYWWILRTGATDNQGLTDTTGNTKRLYALGNWSKFVRPGMVRVGTSGSVSGVSLTAFKNATTGAVAIVAINANATSTTFSLGLSGLSVPSMIPHLTSASANLAAQSAIPASAAMSVTVPATSVTTFVGTGS